MSSFKITSLRNNDKKSKLKEEIKNALLGDIRMLSVRQPWAWALVNGFKTIENRNTKVPSTIILPCWIVVHASFTKYNKTTFDKEMELLRKELCLSGHSSVQIPEKKEFRYGQIVGLVKISRCGHVPEDKKNIWWHHDKYVYEIGSTVLCDGKDIKAKGQLGFGKLKNQKDVFDTLKSLFA